MNETKLAEILSDIYDRLEALENGISTKEDNNVSPLDVIISRGRTGDYSKSDIRVGPAPVSPAIPKTKPKNITYRVSKNKGDIVSFSDGSEEDSDQ